MVSSFRSVSPSPASRLSSREPATTPAVELFEADEQLRGVYLNQGGPRLTEINERVTRECLEAVGDDPATARLAELIAQHRHAEAVAEARRCGRPEVAERQNDLFCLNDAPRQLADGLYRPVDYYTPPAALTGLAARRGWEVNSETGLPIADVVVVGAGPAGLATSHHLAERGVRTVTFEAGLAGQAFSDANAQAVHSLRTSADASNLAVTGHSHLTLEHELSLPGNLAGIRQLAETGRDTWQLAGGDAVTGIPTAELSDRNSPLARAEFYEHMARMAREVATGSDNSFLIERSPVTRVFEEGDLLTLETARGHRLHARRLVVSTGLLGPEGEHSRLLPFLQTPDFLGLKDSRDVARANAELEAHLNGSAPRRLVVADRLLGAEPVRESVKALAPGSRVAVVGSGESAVKAALELAALNPEITVDLFTKGRLEAAQTQLPSENFHPAVLETRQEDEAYQAYAQERFERFGTPVTPRSLQELFELQDQGRIALRELGDYFSPETVKLTPEAGTRTRLECISPAVKAELEARTQEYREAGLAAPSTELAPVEMIVCATGYDARGAALNPLGRQLVDAGLVSAEGGRLQDACGKIEFSTVGHQQALSDSSIPGLAVRGRHVAERLAQEFGHPRDPQPIPRDRGLYWPDTPADEVDGIIANRGLHPNFAESARRRGGEWEKARLRFPSVDDRLRELAVTPPEQLTPAERLTLARAESLAERMSAEYANV